MSSDFDQPLRTPDNVIPFPSADDSDPDQSFEVEIEGDEPQPEDPQVAVQDFSGNLAEHLSSEDRNRIALDLKQAIDEDLLGRREWEESYKDSLKFLGVKEEKRTQPWPGACGIVHPAMLEGITRFQSRAQVKLFPSSGPASIVIRKGKVQEITPEIQAELDRATCNLNEHIMLNMEETPAESDQLLFGLAQIGFAAKKVFFNDDLGRTVTQYTKAENFILPYGQNNLETAHRFTEEVPRTKPEFDELVRRGYFLDTKVDAAVMETMNEVEAAKAELVGQEPSGLLHEGIRTYESYVDLWIDGDQHKDANNKPSPYIVTIEKDTAQLLSIRRNWKSSDPKRKKQINFVLYRYVPADGSMAFGLVHLVGQLSSGNTKVWRQLVDAGTLANLQAGFRSRDARISSKDLGAIAPGEFRQVEIDAEYLQKAFYPLPFKEPSQVLLALLQQGTNEAKRLLQTADLDISASSQNAPVGTTLAIIERQTEVTNAVQLRMHRSFAKELALIVKTIEEREPDVYMDIFARLDQLLGGPGNWYIAPAADPTAATTAQKVIQLQGVMQNAIQMPGVYDLVALNRMYVQSLGIDGADQIVPDKTQSQPMGLVDEQMAFLTGKPVQCYPFYDHKAHITAHMALLNDPMLQQMFQGNPQAQQVVSAIHSDIAMHCAFEYRNEIEKQLGVQLPPIGQPQNPQIEASLSNLVAKAAQQVQQEHVGMAHQLQAAQQQADPAYQLEQQELQIKAMDSAAKHAAKSRELDLKEKDQNTKNKIEVLRINSAHQQAMSAQDRAAEKSILDDDRERTAMAQDTGHRLLDHAEHLNEQDTQAQQMQQQAEQAKAQQEAAAQQTNE